MDQLSIPINLIIMYYSPRVLHENKSAVLTYKFCVFTFRFVKLVRSKTPKVTLYTQRAKCMLMENGPNADFEAVFYDGKFFINLKEEHTIET